MNKNIGFSIGKHSIGPGLPSFIICEIGLNHNGDMSIAKKLIDVAVEAKASAVKFQLRNMDELYIEKVSSRIETQDLALQQSYDFINASHLSKKQYLELKKYCEAKNILFLCTPWDVASVDVLEEFGLLAYKVASADLNNTILLDRLIQTNKPLILSTGMATDQEIKQSYDYLKSNQAVFALLHCNSAYPTDAKDVNLRYMSHLKSEFDVPIGYSGHERGITIPGAAVTLGAAIIEKHLTLDRNMTGPDHVASLEPQELVDMVANIREIESALGKEKKHLSQGVVINIETLRKSLVATKDIKKGKIITIGDVTTRGPGRGLSPALIDKLIGTTAARNISKESFFTEEDIGQVASKGFDKKLSLPWGIPVRFHDLVEMQKLFNPDFLELHLSYKDVLEPVLSNISIQEVDIKVHIPESWPSGFIFDICSPDQAVIKQSLEYLDRTVQTVQKFQKHIHSKQKNIDYIIHAGGFSNDAPLSREETLHRYQILENNLIMLSKRYGDITFLPETMPPLPWLIGGQRFHNIFTRASDILNFSKKANCEICLDLSHSYLYCQYSSTDYNEYVAQLMPITKHIHLADASGTDGEGLVVGNGEISFAGLKPILQKSQKTTLLEIWQGHSNGGAGFTKSLEHLEKLGY